MIYKFYNSGYVNIHVGHLGKRQILLSINPLIYMYNLLSSFNNKPISIQNQSLKQEIDTFHTINS